MDKKIEWLKDFKESDELEGPGKRFSIAESIVYALLVFCVLGAVYAYFEKSELEPVSFSPSAEMDGLDWQEDLG